MSMLAELVRNVLVIIILTSLMEMVLPDGAIKPFVRFAIGLFIIIAVLNQVSQLFGQGQALQVSMWNAVVTSSADRSRIEAQGQALHEKIMDSAGQELHSKLEGQISALVLLVPGVKEVETAAHLDENSQIQAIDLQIRLEEPDGDRTVGDLSAETVMALESDEKTKSEEVIKKIQHIIENLYGAQKVDLTIKIKEG